MTQAQLFSLVVTAIVAIIAVVCIWGMKGFAIIYALGAGSLLLWSLWKLCGQYATKK